MTLYVLSYALILVQGTRVDIMHLAINIRIPYKPSHWLLRETCSRAYHATKPCKSSIFRSMKVGCSPWIQEDSFLCVFSFIFWPRPKAWDLMPLRTNHTGSRVPDLVSGGSEGAILHWDLSSPTAGTPTPAPSSTATASTTVASHATSASAAVLLASDSQVEGESWPVPFPFEVTGGGRPGRIWMLNVLNSGSSFLV